MERKHQTQRGAGFSIGGNYWSQWPREDVQFEEEVVGGRGMEAVGVRLTVQCAIVEVVRRSLRRSVGRVRQFVAVGHEVVGIVYVLLICLDFKTLGAWRLWWRDSGKI